MSRLGDFKTAVGLMAHIQQLNMQHLTPAAQRMVADFLVDVADETESRLWPVWSDSARAFLWLADLGRDDQEVRAALLAGYELLEESLPTRSPVKRRWEGTPVAETRAQYFDDVPYLTLQTERTAAMNLIAEVDAGTGLFVAYLNTLWPPTGPADPTTFGDVIDTFCAAAGRLP